MKPITEHKLARIKVAAEDLFRKGVKTYTLYTDEFLSIIALAERALNTNPAALSEANTERALEPQGQALPELPKEVAIRWPARGKFYHAGLDDTIPRDAPTQSLFSADQMRDFFAQGFAAGRASQLALPATAPSEYAALAKDLRELIDLHHWAYVVVGRAADALERLALPAGPVPMSAEELAAITNAKTNAAMTPKEKRASDRIKARLAVSPSPAVAQPVADEREASDAYFKARHPMLDTTITRNVFSAGFRAALGQPAEEEGKP